MAAQAGMAIQIESPAIPSTVRSSPWTTAAAITPSNAPATEPDAAFRHPFSTPSTAPIAAPTTAIAASRGPTASTSSRTATATPTPVATLSGRLTPASGLSVGVGNGGGRSAVMMATGTRRLPPLVSMTSSAANCAAFGVGGEVQLDRQVGPLDGAEGGPAKGGVNPEPRRPRGLDADGAAKHPIANVADPDHVPGDPAAVADLQPVGMDVQFRVLDSDDGTMPSHRSSCSSAEA